MKVFYWNIRGICNTHSQNAFHNFCVSHEPDMVFIPEPMVASNSLPFNYWSSCNLKFVCGNDIGASLSNPWLLCSTDLDVQVIRNTEQQISLEVIFENRISRISGVYASTYCVQGRMLWTDLIQIATQSIPCL